jgi:phosphate-selective porin
VSVATVAIDTNDVSNTRCYCAFVDLVPPRSLKLGLRYLKTKTYGAILNLVIRPRARMRERPRGFENGVRASWQGPREWLGKQCTRAGSGAPAYGDRS